MVAILLLLPTIAFVPIYFFILPATYIFARKIYSSKLSFVTSLDWRTINVNFLIILLIILASTMNLWINNWEQLSFSQLLPYTIAMPVTYFIAKHVTRKDLVVLVWLISIECLVIIVQYLMGVNTFFSSLDHFNELISDSPDLLYSRRPLGLSKNSSVAAYKLFIAFIILDYYQIKGRVYTLVRVLLLIGILFTFNRTVFLVAFVYVFFSILRIYSPVVDDLLRFRIHSKRLKYIFIGVIGLVIFVTFLYFSFNDIYAQVTRGKGIDLSGRGGIWKDFWVFIQDNFWFGNGSIKYEVPYRGKMAHAHNSFLQVLATHGIFISSLFLFFIFRNLTRKNVLFIAMIILYSLFQYGIFWGISLLDIVFFKILFFDKLENKTKV